MPSILDALSPRERQIADLIGQGVNGKDISARIGIADATRRVYQHNVYRKLGISSAVQLALIAQRARLIREGWQPPKETAA